MTGAEQKRLLEEEKVFRQGMLRFKDLIAPAVLKITPSFIDLGGVYARTIFVTSYPAYITVGWFEPVLNAAAVLDISMYVYPVPTSGVLKQLKTKIGQLEAEVQANAEKGMVRDPQTEMGMRTIDQLRDDLTSGVEHFFQFALYVTMYAESEDKLNKLTQNIEQLLGSKAIATRRSFYQSEQGFTSTLPMGLDKLLVVSNLNSSPIASSFPFMSSDLTSDQGILYGVNRHNNSLIIFDRFSLQNANMVVFATSGAGKSYAVKLEVLRQLMLGVDVMIVDPEKEYLHLCEAVGGTYVNVFLGSEAKINPFDLPQNVHDMSTADIIRSAVIQVKGLIKIMIGALNPTDDSLLDRALLETYAKKDITPGSEYNKDQMPIMSDLAEVLGGMEGGNSILEKLQKYTVGTFSGLLNNPTNVDVNNQLVVFSVRDLEDELRPLAIYNIVTYVWNIVRSQLKKRLLIIDEAWWLMQQEDSAKFIFAMVKRCRKYYLGITTITQDVNDFLGSPYGRAIVTNSALQLLLKQAPAAVDTITTTFLLTEGEKYLLLEGAVGEGIFFAGNHHVAIKIVPSYTEDQIITTDPRQLLELEQAKKDFAQKNAQQTTQTPPPLSNYK